MTSTVEADRARQEAQDRAADRAAAEKATADKTAASKTEKQPVRTPKGKSKGFFGTLFGGLDTGSKVDDRTSLSSPRDAQSPRASPLENDFGENVRAGWLLKLSAGRNCKFQKRYCILREGALYYYHHKPKSESEPTKKCIQLQGFVPMVEGRVKGQCVLFKLVHPSKPAHQFATDSEAILSEWVKALHMEMFREVLVVHEAPVSLKALQTQQLEALADIQDVNSWDHDDALEKTLRARREARKTAQQVLDEEEAERKNAQLQVLLATKEILKKGLATAKGEEKISFEKQLEAVRESLQNIVDGKEDEVRSSRPSETSRPSVVSLSPQRNSIFEEKKPEQRQEVEVDRSNMSAFQLRKLAEREKAAKEREEKERETQAEKERVEREKEEQSEREKMEKERTVREKENENLEKDKLTKAKEKETLEKEKSEKDKFDKQKLEKEKLEKEKLEKEKVDKQKSDKEKLEKEKLEKEKSEKEKVDKLKLDKEKLEKEKERAEKERVAKEKLEKEKLEKEKLEREKIAKESSEKEKIEKINKEKAEKEKFEKDKLDKERADKEKERENNLKAAKEKEKGDKEKAEREKIEKEKIEKEKIEKEKMEKLKSEKSRAEKEKTDKESAEREKLNKEKILREQQEREKSERAEREQAEMKRASAERERQTQEANKRALQTQQPQPKAGKGMASSIPPNSKVGKLPIHEYPPVPLGTKLTGMPAMLAWAQRATRGFPGVQILNFTKSWQNGLAFAALCANWRPDVMDYWALDPSDALGNLQKAFKAAEKMGVSMLLDAEDVVDVQDAKSLYTQMTMFHRSLNHKDPAPRPWENGGGSVGAVAEAEARTIPREVKNLISLVQSFERRLQELNWRSVEQGEGEALFGDLKSALPKIQHWKADFGDELSATIQLYNRLNKEIPTKVNGCLSEIQSKRTGGASFSTCASCGKALGGRTVEAVNMFFHADCFKCHNCGKALVKTCINVKDKPHCDACGRNTLAAR